MVTNAPAATISDYDPGNKLTITAGLSFAKAGWTLGLDTEGKLIYIDRLAGAPLFRNGKQLTAKGSLSYVGRTIRIDTSVTDIVRLKNRKISNGELLYEDRDSNGNDLRARGKVTVTPFEGLAFFGEAHLKDVTENTYDPGSPLFQGASRLWLYGGGATLRIGNTESLTVRVLHGDGWLNDRADDVKTLNAHVSVRLFF